MDVCYMYVCPHIHEMYIIHTCSMQHAACRIYIIIMYDFIFISQTFHILVKMD